MPPRLSVVMATYNEEDFVGTAIESVLGQDFEDFELIIVDDGSTDGTLGLLEEHAARDERVLVLPQENRGLTEALIRGCQRARGEYIARQDADDVSLPGRFRSQVELLDADEGVVLVSCWADYVGPSDEPLVTIERPSDSTDATEALLHRRQGIPAHGTAMFRRTAYERVGGYRTAFYFAQDSDLWLRMVELGRVAYVPRVLYRYRYDPDRISSARRGVQKLFGELGQAAHTARRAGLDETPIVREAERLAERVRRGDPSLVSREPARGYYFVGAALAARAPSEAWAYFLRAVKADPLFLRAWLRLALSLAGRVIRPFRR